MEEGENIFKWHIQICSKMQNAITKPLILKGTPNAAQFCCDFRGKKKRYDRGKDHKHSWLCAKFWYVSFFGVLLELREAPSNEWRHFKNTPLNKAKKTHAAAAVAVLRSGVNGALVKSPRITMKTSSGLPVHPCTCFKPLIATVYFIYHWLE